MLRIPFEWIEFGFECFKSLSSGSNLDSNASNPIRVVRIAFECGIESLSSGSSLHSNASNQFVLVQIWIRIPFEWFEFGFECFECFETLSSGSNLDSNASSWYFEKISH